jgi:hypothetical protein
MVRMLVAAAVLLSFTETAMADKLYGTIVHKDGSKVLKTKSIKTSWNSKSAKYTKDGEYELDFGEKVGKKVIVYVDGDKYTDIEIKGDTRLDIKLKK